MISKTGVCFYAAFLGTTLEWYDYSLFGFLAPTLAEIFFPGHDPWLSLLQALSVFAIGYFLRPVGGIIFGSIADRLGRVVALRTTILLMTLPSLFIACLPIYNKISTFVLILLRLLQGLSVGGEFAGSMVYLTETAPYRWRTLLSGLANNASNIGVLLGVGISSCLMGSLSHDLFIQIGWRIPFLLGGVLGLISYYLRKMYLESDVFLQLQKEKKLYAKPLQTLIKQYTTQLKWGTLLCFMGACSIYTLTVYLSTYLHSVKHYPLSNALALQSLLLTLTLILVPTASILSRYFSSYFLLRIAVFGNIVYALFAFLYLPENNLLLAGLLITPLIIFVSLEQGIMPATLCDVFPPAVRYTGVSIAYNLSYAYIGGAAPMYITWLIQKTQNPAIPAYCIMLTSSLTGLALFKLFTKSVVPPYKIEA